MHFSECPTSPPVPVTWPLLIPPGVLAWDTFAGLAGGWYRGAAPPDMSTHGLAAVFEIHHDPKVEWEVGGRHGADIAIADGEDVELDVGHVQITTRRVQITA